MGARDDISWDDLKRMIAELAQQSKETDRRMQETDRRLQETDRLIRELRESGRETERRMQETDRRLQETDRRIDQRLKQLERQLGQLGNRLGMFVQDMVMPAVVRLFQEQGIPVHRVYPNAVARDDSGQAVMEIDLLVINGEHAIAVECKSRLSSDDVDEHIERLQRFRACFTEHADKVLHGAVAAMGAPDEVVRYAERQGLYVLVQADDDVVVRNQPGFEPKAW
ncbi:hypothetical protein [Tepidimonas ignava]|uniref:hypothetical protein n=1 Tax=Tepidimonas ignava TaxID=114249 RepID=UPI002FD9B37A